jgi:hypothetical protein
MAALFLAVIALVALFEAAVIGALAVGLFRAEQKMATLEARTERDVLPALRRAATAAAQAAEHSTRALETGRRWEIEMSARADRLGSSVERTADSLARAFEAGGQEVEAAILHRATRNHPRVGRGLALYRAFRRGFDAWQTLSGQARR